MVVPTSPDTAIILGMSAGSMAVQPAMDVAAFILLMVFVYSCWEMLVSWLGGDGPQKPHWVWLAVTGSLLVASVVLDRLMSWDATFNAGTANWITTTWGSVIGQYLLLAFEVCALVLLVLRTVEAISACQAGRFLYAVWRLFALLLTMGCGVVLGLSSLSLTSDLRGLALIIAFSLAVLGVGSLAAVAVIGRMRGNGARMSPGASV